MTKNNGSFKVPSEGNIGVFSTELYQKTVNHMADCTDPNTIAVLSTLCGVIALQVGIYRELKNK